MLRGSSLALYASSQVPKHQQHACNDDSQTACRLALFMCQADGSLAIVEVQGVSLPSKPLWVHPKNKSQAVSMVLLAADGGPLFPPGAHMHLTWPNNNMVTAAQHDNALSGGLSSDMPHLAIQQHDCCCTA